MSNTVCLAGYKLDKDGKCVQDDRYSTLISVVKNELPDKNIVQSLVNATSQLAVKDVLKDNNLAIPDLNTVKDLVSANSLNAIKAVGVPPSLENHLKNIASNNVYVKNAGNLAKSFSKFF